MNDTMIYLDNNATTTVAPECIDVMLSCLKNCFGNPSSKHAVGERAKTETIKARSQLAALLGATPPEIVFTGSGTEATHQAILGALAMRPESKRIVTSAVEHPSTLQLLRHLQTQGIEVVQLPVDGTGQIDIPTFERTLSDDTALVTIMWANNETGVVFPLEEIAQLTSAKGVLLHTDAVQAVGKIAIDLRTVPVDFLSLSGHKLHAPKGIGALYVRKGHKIPPLLFGHQERGRRGSTENVPAIAALGVAAELAANSLSDCVSRVRTLRDRLETGLLASLPGASVNGAGTHRLAGTSSVNLGGPEAEFILDKLDRAGIQASAGAACSATGTEPSHVLLAMGLQPEHALSTIRFSLSRYTTEPEIDRVIRILPSLISPRPAEAA